MNSTERVYRAITGQSVDRTPIYGWTSANLTRELTQTYGSVENFEDKYEFDMAHLFGGPSSFDGSRTDAIRAAGGEVTPDMMLDTPFLPVDHMEDYEGVKKALAFHKERGRFCYIQTPGFFEHFNGAFGIENHLCYLGMEDEYGDELKELYRRQAQWTRQFASNMIDLGVDMVHISDDWGAQRSLMFSPQKWRELIFPNMKEVVDHVHRRGCLASLHSDGCIMQVADGIVELGLNMVHPWQEDAGMSYDAYLEKYSDKFAILGGLCIQSTLGFGNYDRLEKEIRRVFGLLKGKRWVLCTTHYVQEHCSVEELAFAYDLIYKLARE